MTGAWARGAALVVALLLASPRVAHATWSVIAVDKATGRVVIASATCVDRDDMFLMGVQAVVVPGKGVAACQAGVDGTHANQMLVYAELQKGTDPQRIIEMLSADPAFQSRQFGILDLQGRGAGHSGLSNGYVSQDYQGQVPGTEIYFSIQGNILRPGEVVPNAVRAFLHTTLSLTDRVMAALETADQYGGDSRCVCPPLPADGREPLVPCEGRTAYVAYMLMADKTDTNGDSHNNGAYAMYLTVAQPEQGGPNAIKAGENLNPVKTLRMRYDAWRKQQAAGTGGRARVKVSRATVPALSAAVPAQPRPAARGALRAMPLTTTAFADGAAIPERHAQQGRDVSPALSWSGAPDSTRSFVLLVHDADAAIGDGTDDTLHWLVWNIPGSATSLAEGVAQGAQLANGMRQISASGPYYRGPAAPSTGPAHHLVFELYALDATVNVPATGMSPAATRAAVMAAVATHVRGKGVMVGTYRRPAS